MITHPTVLPLLWTGQLCCLQAEGLHGLEGGIIYREPQLLKCGNKSEGQENFGAPADYQSFY